MGDLFLELTIASVTDVQRQQEVSFLVDTGATRAWIPQEIAKQVGIEPIGTVALELADGSVQEYPYGACFFSFGGETVAGNVVIGPAGSEPLAGTHVLQDFRLVIDLEHHTISRSRAMKAK
jgi:clan AA aspartic protease